MLRRPIEITPESRPFRSAHDWQLPINFCRQQSFPTTSASPPTPEVNPAKADIAIVMSVVGGEAEVTGTHTRSPGVSVTAATGVSPGSQWGALVWLEVEFGGLFVQNIIQ